MGTSLTKKIILSTAKFKALQEAGSLEQGVEYDIDDYTGVLNGTSAPTTATEAEFVGQLYVDTTNVAVYICMATGSTYTWKQLTLAA